MTTDMVQNEPNEAALLEPQELGSVATIRLLGGLSGAQPRPGVELAEQLLAADFLIAALHGDEQETAAWLAGAGADVVSLAGMRGDGLDAVTAALGGIKTIGAGETESLANAPVVRCVNDVRVGVLACSERRAGGFDGRADAMSLMAYDQVRTLLNQCDHVIVLIRAGLDELELPLPEWRARYRRFIDVGASAVFDTGHAKGWESYKNGLIFYGLGQPADSGSLLVSLRLRQNGRMEYEARALACAADELRYSTDESFKQGIDAQNKLYLNRSAYLRAAGEMCERYYSANERPQKHGVFSALMAGKGAARQEEERLLQLLASESRRFAVLRALRGMQSAEHSPGAQEGTE